MLAAAGHETSRIKGAVNFLLTHEWANKVCNGSWMWQQLISSTLVTKYHCEGTGTLQLDARRPSIMSQTVPHYGLIADEGCGSVPAQWVAANPNAPPRIFELPAKKVPLPTQDNGWDCGLFLLTKMEFFIFALPKALRLTISESESLDKVELAGSAPPLWAPQNSTNMAEFRAEVFERVTQHAMQHYPRSWQKLLIQKLLYTIEAT